MFAKCKISDCGDFAAFAGVWGVPSQRFRISVKDILKHCWQSLQSLQGLSECSDNFGYRNILIIRNIDVNPHKCGKVHDKKF